MTISAKLKAPMMAPELPVLMLLGHRPVKTFTTLAGLFYIFLIDGRERACHETNLQLRRAP